jgi:chromosome segregation ATPase
MIVIKEREMMEDELSTTRKQLREQTGLVEVTPEAVRQMIARLQEQREQLELDAAGAEGRQRAMAEALAKLSAQLSERAESDPVLKELRSVVVGREMQVTRLRSLAKDGAAAASAVDDAEEALAAANADLAAARQRVSGGRGADALDVWNHQMLELSVAAQEREARLKHIAKRLAIFSSALSNLDKLERLRSEIERHDRAVSRAETEVERAKQAIQPRWGSELGDFDESGKEQKPK